MNRIILFETFIFAVVIVSAVFGSIGLERVGQVFLAVGIIDLIMSMAAWRGWPILRGDASNQRPLNKRDSGEVARDEFSWDYESPSTGFTVKIAALGIFSFGIGVILLLYFA